MCSGPFFPLVPAKAGTQKGRRAVLPLGFPPPRERAEHVGPNRIHPNASRPSPEKAIAIFNSVATSYLALFVNAFLAATLLPAMSEVAVVAMARADRFDAATVLLVATSGNTLGSCVNWALGRYLLRFRERRWFPFSARHLHQASGWYNRYGLVSLFFAWLPIIGDPLTFTAGVLKVRFWTFLLLVGAGKAARYAAALLIAEGMLGRSAALGAAIAS